MVSLCLVPSSIQAGIVINEIHYNPDVKVEQVEFVELYNTESNEVDLAGWRLSGGIDYTFGPGATIASAGYLVVSENPADFAAKFGQGVLGPWVGKLGNEGDRVELRNVLNEMTDVVEYQLGFPWPTVGDQPGFSIELVHPSLDNDLGGSWRASVVGDFSEQGLTLLPDHGSWNYFKGTMEASSPVTAWRAVGFNDSSWLTGNGPIGFGEPGLVVTELTDMRDNYGAVFFRKTFMVEDPSAVAGLTLEAVYDDGFKAWINGTAVVDGQANLPAGEVPVGGFAGTAIEDTSYRGVTLSGGAPSTYLVPGLNVLAVQAHNASLGTSSDFFFDARLFARLVTTGVGRGPTPAARNAVFTNNIPPQIRQVDHSPNEPASGETVLLTAKVTDPDGVGSVSLQYQIVDPGAYIHREDPNYETSWTTLPMTDTGVGGDSVAGDDVYSVQLGSSVQVHRRLVRYRITATDGGGRTVQVPYADDPQPNFAYFVYDGIPSWTGSTQSGGTPFTVSAAEMGRLPAVHLISKRTDVETGTWFERYRGDAYKWYGTLVYDGKVYDHINYRARGGVWRYAMAKNMWKFRFNRGHAIEMRDEWGRKFKRGWTRLNLGASIQQGDFNHRGEQGMFESVGFKLFNLGGIESPETAFCTLRIIDEAVEQPADQYEGDFWGVYLITEQEDGRFLDQHGLPDGNLYKMENGTGPTGANGELKNQGPNQPTDGSDVISFQASMNGQSDQWWRDNLDLPRYYNYQTILQGIHHFDVCCGKNYYYYNNPVSGKWEVHTWDLDLTWADNMYVSGVSGGTEPFRSRVLSDFSSSPARPAIYREFQSRVREVRDLLFNTDQAWRVIDEYATLLRGTGGFPNILDADRAKWDFNPKMTSTTYSTDVGSKAGTGRFYQAGTPTKDFSGMVQLMKNYVAYRASQAGLSPAGNGLDGLARDTQIPGTPVVTYTGPGGFPVNRLSFRLANYSGVNPFAAWKWRIASLTPTNGPAADPSRPNKYEIEADWESAAIADADSRDMNFPSTAVRVGDTVRVRARAQDSTGRWSHWSVPAEFVVGEPDSATALLANLRVSELMFNSAGGNEFDFVELHNASATLPLDLDGVKFTQGIDFTFMPGTTIDPGGYLVVVKTNDFDVFGQYYGLDASVPLAGPYAGNFVNSGEQVTLRTSAGGTDIVSFNYVDGRGWPLAADGAGHSLVPLARAVSSQASGALSYGGNWRASTYRNGSPGAADPEPPAGPVLNEIVAHTDLAGGLESNDWIELYNPTGAEIVLNSGWHLSDDIAQLDKWMIPAGTRIPARGWVSFDEVTGFHNPTNIGFGLNKSGEQVVLSFLPGNGADRVVDAVRFKGQENDWAWGRTPDGGPWWQPLTPRTRDGANPSAPPQLVITEIMYHPPDLGGVDNDVDEFIEIYNPTGVSVALFDTNGTWRLDGGIGYLFPSNLTLAAMEYLLVVNFEPSDAFQLAAFREQYGIAEGTIQILGPFSGKLNNSSERVALERPQAADLPGDTGSWVIVDEVIFGDQVPWPLAADGFGPSLQRLSSSNPGNDPANWQAALPGTGAPYVGGTPPVITVQPSPPSLTSRAGANVSYSVSASGTGPLSYQWLFNGNVISGQTGPTLSLLNAQPQHSGAYSVLVLNPAGSAASDAVLLTVTTPPQIFTQPQAMTVVPGVEVTLTVFALGTGEVSYQWRFNGQPIPGAQSPSYTIANVQGEHDGFYSVVVSDMNGAVISDQAWLRVLIEPSFVLHPTAQFALPNSTVIFTVETAGTLPMGYRWRKGGQTLDNQVLNSHVSYVILQNVTEADQASYSCVITNEAFFTPGVLSRIARLTVLSDGDGDGMDDDWETANGFDPANAGDAGLDTDGDGYTNKEEYEAGTDPRDPSSYLAIEEVESDLGGSGTVFIRFVAVSNKTYSVQGRNSLEGGFWSRVADVASGPTNRVAEVLDQPGVGVGRRYYRLVTPIAP